MFVAPLHPFSTSHTSAAATMKLVCRYGGSVGSGFGGKGSGGRQADQFHRPERAKQSLASAPSPPVRSPTVHLDDKQQASGALKLSTVHGNADWSVSVTDKSVRDGDLLNGLMLGMRLSDGSLEAQYGEAW